MGRQDLDDLGAGRRSVDHEVVVNRADAPLADLGPPLELVDLGARRLGPNLSAQFLLNQNTAHDQVSHTCLLLNVFSRLHCFGTEGRMGTRSASTTVLPSRVGLKAQRARAPKASPMRARLRA